MPGRRAAACADVSAAPLALSPRTGAGQERLEEMRRDESLYERMARSIAPNVHGHIDVKRALLLMLLGGMHKVTKEVRRRRPAWLAGAAAPAVLARDGVARCNEGAPPG